MPQLIPAYSEIMIFFTMISFFILWTTISTTPKLTLTKTKQWN